MDRPVPRKHPFRHDPVPAPAPAEEPKAAPAKKATARRRAPRTKEEGK